MISQKTVYQALMGAGAVVGVGLLSAPANAIGISFDLTQFTDQADPTTITSGGIDLTASNFNTGNGAGVDADGLCIAGTKSLSFCGNDEAVEYSSFDLTFSQDVKLMDYTVGYASLDSSLFETLFSTASASSLETGYVLGGPFDFSNQFQVSAGETISVVTTFPIKDPGLNLEGTLQFSSITIDDLDPGNNVKVPEPVTILGTLVAGGIGTVLKRKKGQQS